MAPHVGRIAFRLGMTVLVLALIPLPFLHVGSAEFVVDIVALGVSGLFLLLVSLEVRRQARLHLERKGNDDEHRKETP